MHLFFKVFLGILWLIVVAGIIALMSTHFQYDDLNVLVLVFLVFAVTNSFLIGRK